MVNMFKVVIAVVVLIAILGIALLGKNLKRFFIFNSARPKRTESYWLEVVMTILPVGIAFFYYFKQEPEATTIMWIGTAIVFLGGLLQIYSRKGLYNNKTFEERLHEGFKAAQTGIYARLRYPGKTAAALMLLGLCMTLGSWWSVGLVFFLYLPSMLYHISQQEQHMSDSFGARWLDYSHETKRIIPGVF